MKEKEEYSIIWKILVSIVATFIAVSIIYPVFLNHPVAVVGLNYKENCFPDTLVFSNDGNDKYIDEITFRIKNSGNSAGFVFARLSSDMIDSKSKISDNFGRKSEKIFFLENNKDFSNYKFYIMNNNYSEIDIFYLTLEYGYHVNILLFFSIPIPGFIKKAEYQKDDNVDWMYNLISETN